MKRFLILLIVISCSTFNLLAQSVPQGMKYQAVARDAQGKILANQPISLKVTFLKGGSEGEALYSEIHRITSNQLGLFDLTLGQGERSKSVKKSISALPWSEDEVWMDIAIDETGGDNFISIGTSQLLTVPYAFHAGTADQLTSDGRVIAKNGNTGNRWTVGGNIFNVPGPHTLGTLEAVDLVFITNDITRLTISADGDIDIENSLSVGADIDVGNDATIGNDLSVGGNTDLTGTLDVDGIARFNNTTQSTTKDNGAVIVEGGVGIEKNLNVGGAGSIKSTTQSTSTSSGALTVLGGTGIAKNLNVGGTGSIKSTTQSNSTSSGALTVSGGTGIAKNLYVGGTTNLTGKTIINASVTGAADNTNNYPLLVQGGQHGVAIKVTSGNPHRSVNFLTLFNGSGSALGRIEGFDASQDAQSIARSVFEAALSTSPGTRSNFARGEGPAPLSSGIKNFLNSINSDFGIGIVQETLGLIHSIVQAIIDVAGCAVIIGCDDIPGAVVDVIHSGLQLGIHITYFVVNEGVAFESGGADYAEWLMKADPAEMIYYGDIVGVKGGLVSKTFTEADKFMVVSMNPTVIGAMPDAEKQHLFEKIAFMGQAPVKVIGTVTKGDYILPSGNGDGLAIAVAPDAMQAKDYGRIIGIAWEDSDGKELYKYINTAVGINSNDMANLIEQMQGVMNEMQKSIAKLDPDFDPQFYSVDQKNTTQVGYATAPNLDQLVSDQYSIDAYNDAVVAFDRMKEQNLSAGLNMDMFPYLSDLIHNPKDKELSGQALGYYMQVAERLQLMLAEVNNMQQGK